MERSEIELVKQAVKDYPLSEFWTRGEIKGVGGEYPTHNSELFEDIVVMSRRAGYDLKIVKMRTRGRPRKKKGGVNGKHNQ